MKKKLVLLAMPLLALTGDPVFAQMPGASQQVEIVQQRNSLEQAAQSMTGTNVPALYEGETSDVGPQSVLKMKPRRTWIQASADEQYFYTDNMFLADHGQQGADVLVSTVQAALAPTPFEFHGGQLAPRVGYQHQWFNYDIAGSSTVNVIDFNANSFGTARLDLFDFNVSTVFGDLAWQRDNWTFSLGADFRRLLDSGSYNEFYREYVPRWSVRRDFPITPTTAISLAYEGDYRVTDTAAPVPPGYTEGFNDRTDHSLVVFGSWRLCSHAILQPVYRFEFIHYTGINRDDLLNSCGLTLYCPLTKNVTLRGFVGYDNLKTDGFYAQHYEQLTAGGGVNLTVSF
jgi:hypothetical protein